ncbi:DNA-binding domain-containing protein [Chitinivorax sp. B]|uniref:HvfC/BufC N-terminal domain-containing protein n=1 Tax=Chitinivorax sp. B TaxID=2502235 RepID=UPI0010F4F128|nr:DNA-binding domain-containing protein [Chitinivorax sp. B]
MNPLFAVQGRFADAVVHGTLVESEWDPHTRGLSAYANNRLCNRVGALVDAYPTVRELVGEAFFDGMAHEYARCMASHSGNLHQYGDVFSAFLRQFEPAKTLPYLPDVAALDWAMRRAYFEHDVPAFDPASLATYSNEQQARLIADIHPAASLLHASYPVVSIYQAHHGGEWPALDQGPECALVFRRTNRVLVRALVGAELAFCTALMTGDALGDAVGAAIQKDPQFALGDVLMRLVVDQLVINLSLPA